MSSDLRRSRSEEHTSELQSLTNIVCRLLLEKKNCASILYASPQSNIRTIHRLCRVLLCVSVSTSSPLPSVAYCSCSFFFFFFFFFFNDTATTEIYTLSLYDALPISFPSRLRLAVWLRLPSSAPIGSFHPIRR